MLGDSLNAVRWQGKRQRPFHEVWYLTAIDPTSGDAYWFRYTIDAPRAGAGDIEVGLWAITTPKANPKSGLALHDKMAANKFVDKSNEEKGFRVECGKYFLERNRATGKVGTGDRSIEWDLKWEPNGVHFEHVSGVLTGLGVAKSAVNSAYLSIEVNGTIKVGGKAIKVTGWPAEQSHVWGSSRPASWAWAHCSAFAEDKTAVFEGLSGVVRKLGLELPAATPIYFRSQGEEHSWNGVGEAFANRSTAGKYRWEFEAESQEALVRGVVTTTPDRMISVEYREGDGSSFFVQHATAADMSVELWRRVGFRWELEKKLTSQGTTAFEIAGHDRNPEVARRLDLAETRNTADDEAPKPAAKPAAATPATAVKA